MQRAIVAIADLVDDIEPQAAGGIARKVLSERVGNGLAVRPCGRFVANGEALLDADAQVAHPDDHVFPTRPRIGIPLRRQIAPILAVVENIVAQFGHHVFELADFDLGIAQFLRQNRLDPLTNLAQHGFDIDPFFDAGDLQ